MTADIIMQSSNMYPELQPPPVMGVSSEEEQRAWQIALQLSNLAMLGSYEDVHLEDARGKKQNMTECVPVPSSEHVAEIVGKQGNINAVVNLLSCIDVPNLILNNN